ncbi:MAG: alpha/beta fold hydrolase [Anaerolineales bacterium]|nr:MAG: alpha/beta fold hydrolase [Anaerolineales bacterium]
MQTQSRLIFLHGLEGSSQGVKASLLRSLFPGILTPDFRGSLEERLAKLRQILGDKQGWKIIGSSFGGLMAALVTCERPQQVAQLVLLAPALVWPDFANQAHEQVAVPTIIFHGSRDELLPLNLVRSLAERTFSNLDFRVVDDDHGLYHTVHSLDWGKILGEKT